MQFCIYKKNQESRRFLEIFKSTWNLKFLNFFFLFFIFVHRRVDPVGERSGEFGVDSGMVWRGAAVSPADDAVLNSCCAFLANERSAGIALARIVAAVGDPVQIHVRNAGAEFRFFDFFRIVSCRDALLARENVDSDVFQLKKGVNFGDFCKLS